MFTNNLFTYLHSKYTIKNYTDALSTQHTLNAKPQNHIMFPSMHWKMSHPRPRLCMFGPHSILLLITLRYIFLPHRMTNSTAKTGLWTSTHFTRESFAGQELLEVSKTSVHTCRREFNSYPLYGQKLLESYICYYIGLNPYVTHKYILI